MPCLERDGHDLFGEGAKVGVHDVDGHLDGVEVEVVLVCAVSSMRRWTAGSL